MKLVLQIKLSVVIVLLYTYKLVRVAKFGSNTDPGNSR